MRITCGRRGNWQPCRAAASSGSLAPIHTTSTRTRARYNPRFAWRGGWLLIRETCRGWRVIEAPMRLKVFVGLIMLPGAMTPQQHLALSLRDAVRMALSPRGNLAISESAQSLRAAEA